MTEKRPVPPLIAEAPLDVSKLTPVAGMKGEDREETHLLGKLSKEAETYITSFRWCAGVREMYFGAGIGGIFGLFLFRIKPLGPEDQWLWIMVGDLPSCYFVTDRAKTPASALEVYCELMEDWVDAVRNDDVFDEVFPVAAAKTLKNADLLASRIHFIRQDMIPRKK